MEKRVEIHVGSIVIVTEYIPDGFNEYSFTVIPFANQEPNILLPSVST